MAFAKGNKLKRFTGMKHKPESNAKRSESMKKLYRENRPKGMGFRSTYRNEEERRKGRLSSQMKCRYGITYDQYEELLDKQNNTCAVCGEEPKKKRLMIDHNHDTNEVRGLLCSTCNTLLGFAKDSTYILAEASLYLFRTNTKSDHGKAILRTRLERKEL